VTLAAVVAAVSVSLAAPAPALAQVPPPPAPPVAPPAPAPPAAPAPPSNPAAELAAGDKAAKSKDFAGALGHYQAALQAAPSARAELGVADALYQLNRVGEAYDAYAAAQETYGSKLAGGDKTLVAGRLKELAAKTGALSVHVDDAGADVTLDGTSIGTSPVAALVRVPVGRHEVRVSKAGYVPFVGQADVAPDAKAVIDATPLAQQSTRGHVIVQAPAGESLRVIVDGLDLGATPWEGDLPAGPHEITGRSSTSTATAQTVNVGVGDKLQIDLVTAATAAHLQVQTNDGKGRIYVDGVQKGEGAFQGDLTPGVHALVVEREGYQRYEKSVTLGERETWAETVTLKPVEAASGASVATPERAYEGVYGGFGFAGLLGVGGMGTDLDTNCQGLGATSCSTGQPVGGGAFGYVGYTWNPVGFEVFLAGEGDTLQETAHFTGQGSNAISSLATPPRDEKFTTVRVGGMAAVRVRASVQTGIVRGTVAGGVGIAYKQLFMERETTTTDGTDRKDTFSPTKLDGVGYLSPALTLEAAVQLRVAPTLAVAAGMVMWADTAGSGSSTTTPADPKRFVGAANQTPAQVATPAYHLATGPQVFLGPFLGMQFGP
jgi:PEGA domain